MSAARATVQRLSRAAATTTTTTSDVKQLLEANREWARRVEREQPGFFTGLARGQSPKYLWIGCSDSRVPANQIVGLPPGEVFVHRNVANVVNHGDTNAMAVLEFAVGTLGVEHVIVCGHMGCGGVEAALHDSAGGRVRDWIKPVRGVADRHVDELRQLGAVDGARRLCQLNALAQAREVVDCSVVRDARERGAALAVHAWCYDVADGLIENLWSDLG